MPNLGEITWIEPTKKKKKICSCAATTQRIEKARLIYVHEDLLESMNFSVRPTRFFRAGRRPSMALSK
jgi:hypothetical protein